MIITIGRICGSGGHSIGQNLANHYGLKFFDTDRLIEHTKNLGKYEELESFFMEKSVDSLTSSISINDTIKKVNETTLLKFKEILPSNNFVLIGRCGNYLFQDNSDSISIFITADYENSIKRTSEIYSLQNNIKETKEMYLKINQNRSAFHEYYTSQKWGYAENYQISLNSSKLGYQKSLELLKIYIDQKLNHGFSIKKT